MCIRRFIAVLTSAVLLATACAGSTQPVATPDPGATGRVPGVLHVYGIHPLTGPNAAFGKRPLDALILRAKQINDAGGFTDSCGNPYTVKITGEDMANSREQAVALLRKAAADSTVIGDIGPVSSIGFVPMVPVAGQLGFPIMSVGSAAAIPEWNQFAYRINVVVSFATPIMMESLEKKFDIKRLAIIYDITQDGDRVEAELMRDIAAKVGYQVVAFEAFRTGDTDMRAQLTKIKGTNPDWIAYEAASEDMARVLNQSFELGLGNIPMVTGQSQFDNANVWDLTQGKTKGGYSWSAAVDTSSSDQRVTQYIDEYKRAVNDDPSIYSLYARDALDLFVDVAKRSCTVTDRAKFNTELRKTSGFTGLATKVTFGPDNGENRTPLVKLTRVTDRQRTEEIK